MSQLCNQLNICRNSDLWLKEPDFNDWTLILPKVLDATINNMNLRDCEVNLLLTDDNEVRRLNYDFRNIDKPTNVLSFPQYEQLEGLIFDVGNTCIGDIAMAFETIKKEAIDFNKLFFDRATHLFVHGTLHLLGLDHVEENEKLEMERIETEILTLFNIKDPYILG